MDQDIRLSKVALERAARKVREHSARMQTPIVVTRSGKPALVVPKLSSDKPA